MEDTRDGEATRSPKRQAHASAQFQLRSPCDSTARTVMAWDAVIWTSIVEFLPMPEAIELVADDGTEVEWDTRIAHYEGAVSEVVATWQTLLNLRLVNRELAILLHPVDNAVLWEKLLLHGFDFSFGGAAYYVECCKDEHGLEIPGDEVDEDTDKDVDEDADEDVDEDTDKDEGKSVDNNEGLVRPQEQTDDGAEQGPQLVAMRGRYYSMPDDYLEEELVQWSKLGIYHRPSQFGFLTTLQHDKEPATAAWPETEDAFTLFGDLVRLLTLSHGEAMESGGEGCETMPKYLAASTEGHSRSAFYNSYAMQSLGYAPHFWHWAVV